MEIIHSKIHGTLGVYNKTEKCQNDSNYASCITAFEEMEKTVSSINDLINSVRWFGRNGLLIWLNTYAEDAEEVYNQST